MRRTRLSPRQNPTHQNVTRDHSEPALWPKPISCAPGFATGLAQDRSRDGAGTAHSLSVGRDGRARGRVATLLPKPDLPKPVSHNFVPPNRSLWYPATEESVVRNCVVASSTNGATEQSSGVRRWTQASESHAFDSHNRPWAPPIHDRQRIFLYEQR